MMSNDPIIVLAAPRSFSTVTCAMVGQHPQLYGLPETFLFTHETVGEWWADYDETFRMDGLLRAVAEIIFGGQTQAQVNRARAWLQERLNWGTDDVFKALSESVSPRALVEKTPRMSARLEHIDRVARKFPRARFLHVVRHPLGQVQSRLERVHEKNSHRHMPPQGDISDQFGGHPEIVWFRCNSNIIMYLESISPERQMLLRGEDLLAEPEIHLRHFVNWLGLRADAEAIEAMKHPEASPFASVGPPNAPSGGDKKFLLNPALRPPRPLQQSLDGPVPWKNGGARLPKLVQDLALRLGYQ
ncbi:MAG TPA: sulfotransferase [Pyrinomonadaceae bacterium]|jgi:hypothetical protein|nr:sulfotransferase [Pyrinomonadaceae bacterium]